MNKLKKQQIIILVIFLLGVLTAGLDGAIVNPVRPIIAQGLNVSVESSIWMISIYTLFFTISIPLSSKLADVYGKQLMFKISISIFGIASFMAGGIEILQRTNLSDETIYQIFLSIRAIQAIGGGGILPIAVGYITTNFPEERRGFALGFISMVFGIANILGPTLGSTILSIFGEDRWGYIFYINVPIVIGILIAFRFVEKEDISKAKIKIDYLGALALTVLIGSLMYFILNLDINNLKTSIFSTQEMICIVLFLISLPSFIFIETRVKDPIIELKHFKNRDITLIIILSMLVGMMIMVGIFLPIFGENVLSLSPGSGGYVLTFLSIFMIFASISGGKLIDQIGAKKIFIAGVIINFLAYGILAFIVTQSNSAAWLFVGLALIGLANGFTVGAPLNYLISKKFVKNEITLGQSVVTLFRSIGITIAPAILINVYINNLIKEATNLDLIKQNIIEYLTNFGINPSVIEANKIDISDYIQNITNANVTTVIEQLQINFDGSAAAKFNNFVLTHQQIIQNQFQNTLNNGFQAVFIAFMIINTLMLIFIIFVDETEQI